MESLTKTQTTQKLILDNTLSPCSKCFKIVPARIVEDDGKIFLEKECCEKEHVLLENDAYYYKNAILPFTYNRKFLTIGKNRYSREIYEKLCEEASVLMLNVTSRCNLLCPICVAELGPAYFPRRDIPFEKISGILRTKKSKLIIISGGEPTVRKDLPKIIESIVKSGNTPELYTNGLKLCDRKYVKKLKDAGLKIVCLSFDGFNEFAYQLLRGKKLLKKKLKALKNLKEEGMIVWLIPVIGRGVNEGQVKLITKFACLNSDFIRGIRFSTLYPRDESRKNERITSSDIIKILEVDCGIKMEYFIESKRFYYNIYKLVGKFSKRLQTKFNYLVQDNVYLKVKTGNYTPLFSINYLKKLNWLLEKTLSEKNRIKSLISLIRNAPTFLNRELLKFGLMAVFNFFNLPKASLYKRRDLLIIKVGDVHKATVEDLKRKFSGEVVGIFLDYPAE
jgi:uncharacterized radical SAM superfamily Fe-S cluster-containing enzyme